MTSAVLGALSGSVMGFGWFAVVFFIGYMVLRWRTMSPLRLSVPGIAFSTYIGLLLIPALILAPTEQDEEAAQRFVLLTILAGAAMLMGMGVISLVYPARNIDPLGYVRMPVLKPNKPAGKMAIPIILIVVLATSVLRFAHRGTIPFLHLLTNMHSYANILASREAIKEVNEQVNPLIRVQLYLTSWSELILMPLVVFVALAMYRTTKARGWSILFWLSVCGAMFLGLWDADKSSGARMAATLLGGTLLIRSRLSWKLVTVGVAALGLPLAIAIAIHPENMERSKIYDAMASRAFVAPAQITYFYVEAFPKFHPHTLGRGTYVLGGMLGREPVHLPRLVARYVMGGKAADTYVNCGFIGTGWAEFGFMGVLVYSMGAGALAQMIQNCIMRRAVHGKRVNWILFHAVQIPMWTVVLASAGITEFFLGRGLVIAFVLAWGLDRVLYAPLSPELSEESGGWEATPAPPPDQIVPVRNWRTPVAMGRGPVRP
ncbi:MAG TPA: hypothetical protein VMV94_09300 [Phycisphaerae bacterium]|nr:hypothetical protein [Phycisphaerae bacterium]